MVGLGTILNVAAIVAGGLIGLVFSRAISARYQQTLMQAIGVCVIFVGIGGAVQEMVTVTADGLQSGGTMMVIICVMSASMGKGCLFAAIPVGILQGAVTLLARAIQPLMTEAALANLSLTGSILIFCVGINLLWEKKLKVANMLPSIVVAVVLAFAGI